jgi:hypothetical protein
MPDDAVHILDPTAAPTDQMVMVVACPRFIERGGVRGFDASYQSSLQQGVEIIVYGLSGKASEAFAGHDGDRVRMEMPAVVDRRQYGEPGAVTRIFADRSRSLSMSTFACTVIE